MSTQTQQSFSWLRRIPGDLLALDEKPLLGFPPPFPWDKFVGELNRSLQTKEISITPGQLQWHTKDDLFAGLGDHLCTVTLSVAPLAGKLFWVIPEKAVVRIMQLLLIKEAGDTPELGADPDFITASLQFFAIEAIAAFQKLEFDKKLSPTVLAENAPPNEPCLGLDINLSFKGEPFYARLLIPQNFRKAWMERYTLQKPLLAALPMAESLEVVVHLVAGRIDLKPSEWQQLTVGDFVLLDACSMDPDEEKGNVTLVINDTPCLQARIEQGKLKILEPPTYFEVGKFTATLPSKDSK